jgi:spoIIIJ-associated protein
VRELVELIADGIGVRCRVEVSEDEEAVVASCTGRELGGLIGRHGQTIDAIQYLANAIAWRELGDSRKSVVIDAAGYRERRRATLEAMALRAAERARAGDPVALEPMSAVERKVVHLRLADEPGVRTLSEGTEPNRYVVVEPDA